MSEVAQHVATFCWTCAFGFAGVAGIDGAVVVSGLISQAASATDENSTIIVELDRAQFIKVWAGSRALVIDDPLIARATLLAETGQLLVTGVSYGQIHITVLGSHEAVIASSTIRMKEPTNVGVAVYRGLARGT